MVDKLNIIAMLTLLVMALIPMIPLIFIILLLHPAGFWQCLATAILSIFLYPVFIVIELFIIGIVSR